MVYHLDYETRSECDIKLGTHRYAEDPTTRILMFAIGDGLALNVWDSTDQESLESRAAASMFRKAISGYELIYAHNAEFEMAVTLNRLAKDVGVLSPVALSQWRCTAAMARSAAIPASLDGASDFLKLASSKDKKGKALINIFSIATRIKTLSMGKERLKVGTVCPVKHADWTVTVAGEHPTVAEAWRMFIEYCRQDVRAEMELHQRLSKYELTGEELKGWQFTTKMNLRGIPLNVPAIKAAEVIADEHRDRLTAEFHTLTGLQPTQTQKVKQWLQDHGYAGDDLTADSLNDDSLSDCMSDSGSRALQIRRELSFVAVKKLPAMLKAVSADDRLRSQFIWFGAQKTGRWTSKGVQLQNAKRPTIDDSDACYRDIQAGFNVDDIMCFHGNPFEAVASCVRHFVQPHGGAMMLDADYSNIEGRVAAWVAGLDHKLDAYRKGEDQYVTLASEVFKVPVDQVTKEQRFVGKVGELSLVYGSGAKGFWDTCAAWGMPIDKKLAAKTVKVYREVNEDLVKLWRRFDYAMVAAIGEQGEWVKVNDLIRVAYSYSKPFPRMLVELPSGRRLTYPYPKVDRTEKTHTDFITKETRTWESSNVTFHGHRMGNNWGRVHTHGADVFQSCAAKGTLVLTSHGFVRIEDVTCDDLIWDGVEFVECQGVVSMGEKVVIEKHGIAFTPDHLFMVDTSWSEWSKLDHAEVTSESKELARSTIRQFGSSEAVTSDTKNQLAGAVQMWCREINGRVIPAEVSEDPRHRVLSPGVRIQRDQENEARTILQQDLPCSRLDDGKVLPPEESELSEIWWKRDKGVREVARQAGVLRGYAPVIRGGSPTGSRRQQRQLQPGELPVGDCNSERKKQGEHALLGYSVGVVDGKRRVREVRSEIHNSSLPNGERCVSGSNVRQTEFREEVYDVVNCGPRNRFAVLTDAGLIIAHNCIQATARDIMQHGCIEAERRGHDIFALIHDQGLGEDGVPEDFIEALCHHPDWLPADFPLEAAGGRVPYYSKD